jgi:metal transporter CNNM
MRELVQESAVHKHQLTDFYLARWLIARQWNLENATKMFLESMNWRKENNIDDIRKTFPTEYAKDLEPFQKFYSGGIFTTIDGWPMFVERAGLMDPLSILRNTSPDFVLKLNIWRAEVMEKMRRKREKETGMSTGVLTIIDMQGVGWNHMSSPVMDSFKENATLSANNYPEALRRFLVINAPSFFTMIWNSVSGWLDKRTRDKTSVYGSDYLKHLLEVVSIDELSSSFGGNGPALLPGGVYQPYEQHSDSITVDIPAGKLYQKDIDIQNTGKLEWNFKSQHKDIGFAVYKIVGKEKKELFPWTKLVSNTGTMSVEPGRYAIVWDNHFSWTKKKTIHYHIAIS